MPSFERFEVDYRVQSSQLDCSSSFTTPT